MSCTVELRGTADALLRELVAVGVPQLERALQREDHELPRFVAREFATERVPAREGREGHGAGGAFGAGSGDH